MTRRMRKEENVLKKKLFYVQWNKAKELLLYRNFLVHLDFFYLHTHFCTHGVTLVCVNILLPCDYYISTQSFC